MIKEKAIFNVSLKVLIERDGKFLILTDNENKFDLPGGRIDIDENKESLGEIIGREISEELGGIVEIEDSDPIMCFRRIFVDDSLNVFIVVFRGKKISGEISISDEHNGYHWMSPEDLIGDRNNFYSEEEYLSFKKFLNKKAN